MQIYGVVNVSPDSLADFTIGTTPDEAVEVARRHIEDGADFIDLGGQASHGDAALVSPDQEWSILEAPLRAILELGVDVSVDTWQVETARRAFDAGAAVLNAADALQAPGMIENWRPNASAPSCCHSCSGPTHVTSNMLKATQLV